MITKLVTAYWMDVDGYPFQGASASRKDRYLGSLTSHCKNLGHEIICYTHNKNLSELLELKKIHNLENLTIKLLELTDMKLHNEISVCRNNFYNTDLDGRGPEIMWGKFDILDREINGTDKIFWLDVGLQHPGIFPWMYCVPYNNRSYHEFKNGEAPYWNNIQQTQYNFGLIYNKKLIDKLKEITNEKMFIITTDTPQTSYGEWMKNNIVNYNIIKSPYIIAGMFGGDSRIVSMFIEKFWYFAKKALDNNFLVTEESIMKVVLDSLDNNLLIPFSFSAHQCGYDLDHHFNIWSEKDNRPKPLYMIWNDILNY